MPRLDQRGECAFGGGFGLAESIPPRVFPGPLAARRQTFQAGHLVGRNLRTSITTNKIYVFSLVPARWDQERPIVGASWEEAAGERRAIPSRPRRLSSPQCEQ